LLLILVSFAAAPQPLQKENNKMHGSFATLRMTSV